MSLMSVLNVGTRALQSSQLGIDITGQNIASADVEGYSRKRINLTTIYARDSAYGQMGLGAEVVNIERMRNQFLDEQIRKQNTEVGYFTEIASTFQRMEAILIEPSDIGIMAYVDQFFNAWQNVINNPEDMSARTMVRTEAEVMINNFRKTALELADLRQQKNEEIPMRLDRINQITTDLVNLNHEVATVEIGNQNANDSRDRRDQLLKELSELIEINVVENALGQITITTSGHVLVAPAYKQTLEPISVSIENPDGTFRRDVGIRFSESRIEYIPTGGQLRGLIDSRDIYIPEYQAKLDELAAALIISVNEIHVEGYNLMGYSGFNFFQPLPIEMMEVTELVNGVPTTVRVPRLDANGNPKPDISGAAANMRLSPAILQDPRNVAAAVALQSEVATTNIIGARNVGVLPDHPDYWLGYQYGDAPLQLWQGGTPTLTSAGVPVPGQNDILARNVIANSATVTVRTKNGAPLAPVDRIVLREGIDYHIDYVLGTFQMLHDGYDGEEFQIDFKFFQGGFEGPGSNANAVKIAELRNTLTMTANSIGENTATFAEFYSSVIGRLGLNTNQSTSNLQTRVFLMEQYEMQQDMIAGVSLDEEMANLIRFQHTYTAAARLITTADRMLETLLNM